MGWAERCQAEAMGAIMFGDRETPECSADPVTERNGFSLCADCAHRLDRKGSLGSSANDPGPASSAAMIVCSAFVGAFLAGPLLSYRVITPREGVIALLTWSIGFVMGKRVIR